MVSQPIYAGGLGFDFKWNMGWMHDTLKYFQTDPLFRAGNHNALTFGLVYAWSENFILPFSHDEVVHMKGSLLNKMPGPTEQKFANLRALYAYMWAHPGKKLLFMGGEFGQWREWTETESLDWHLIEDSLHGGVQKLVRELNRLYGPDNALWEVDAEPAGFEWIDVDNALENIVAFVRRSPQTSREIICVCNFSAVPRKSYRVELLEKGDYDLILNTDSEIYGGSESVSVNGSEIDLPPLSTLWFAPRKATKKSKPQKGTKRTEKKSTTKTSSASISRKRSSK
jgi:1,4-alpha-glucan branching enzyme